MVPIRLVSVANCREHWSAKAKRTKAHRQAGFLLTPKGIELPAVVTITRVGIRPLDSDNLASCAKALRDGIAQKIGIDDGDSRITWLYAQRRGAPKEFAAEVEITKLSYGS